MANSQITDSSFGDGSLGQLQQTYYDKKALARIFQNLVFYNLADKKTLPKNSGQLYSFYRYGNIQGTSYTAAINEGTTTANQAQLTATTTLLTTQVFGAFITLSKYAVDTVRSGQLVEDAVDVLSDTASDIIDRLIASNLRSNSTAYYGTALNKTSASILTSDIMTSTTIRKGVRGLQANNVHAFTDGQKYPFVIHPNAWYDVSSDTTVGGFAATAQYSQPNKIWNGEVGSIAGARLVLSQSLQNINTTAQITADVTAVAYESFMVGRGSVACANLEGNPIQIITKSEGGSYDPFSNITTVAAKLPGFGVVYTGADATNKRSYRIITSTTA